VPRGCCRPCCTASHSGRDDLFRGVGEAVPRCDSQARRGTDSPLTWAPANVSALNPPVRGAIETESRSRGRPAPERGGIPLEGRPALERGGTSSEGATGLGVRRSFTSAASPPSSEAEFCPRVSRPPAWRAVGPCVYFTRVVRFVCVCFFTKVSGSSLVV
jgi:hypothetical protein